MDPLDALPSLEIEQRCLEDLDLSLERMAQSDALSADFDLVAYGRTSWNPSRRFSPIDWPIPRPTSRPGLPTLPFEAESFDLVLCGQGVTPMLLLERGRAD